MCFISVFCAQACSEKKFRALSAKRKSAFHPELEIRTRPQGGVLPALPSLTVSGAEWIRKKPRLETHGDFPFSCRLCSELLCVWCPISAYEQEEIIIFSYMVVFFHALLNYHCHGILWGNHFNLFGSVLSAFEGDSSTSRPHFITESESELLGKLICCSLDWVSLQGRPCTDRAGNRPPPTATPLLLPCSCTPIYALQGLPTNSCHCLNHWRPTALEDHREHETPFRRFCHYRHKKNLQASKLLWWVVGEGIYILLFALLVSL